MDLTQKLIELSEKGYEDITLSESNLVKLIGQVSHEFPLLVGDKKMWIHLKPGKDILVETDIGVNGISLPIE